MNAFPADLETLAERILAATDCPVVHSRIFLDVFQLPEHDLRLRAARKRLESSQQVQILLQEQYPEGSWGRFHSRDSRLKQHIPTTEMGVERAVALGLGPWHPNIARTRDYLGALLSGLVDFPDPPEVNKRWDTGVQLFTASTLARLDPQDKRLQPVRMLWREITLQTFLHGTYDEAAETQAHARLTSAPVPGSYLVLRNKYALYLLGSQSGTLPVGIEKALLRWLWSQPQGIGYLSVPLKAPLETLPMGAFERWFASLELMSIGFPTWVKFTSDSMAWLWEHRNMDALWDFGPRDPTSCVLPFSDHWRSPHNRVIDWSTRTLCLYARYYRALDQLGSNTYPNNKMEKT